MLAFISKAFGFSHPPEHHPLMPRQINLSGNLVHFSVPENFSRDMPADDMIETVDLADKTVYQNDQAFTLIRRWWDFKESGFFAKEYGSLMMSLYIKQASESLSINTLKPLDFIDIIIDDINKNKSDNYDPAGVYSDYFFAYDEEWFNDQRWLRYAQGPSDVSQYTFLYAIPVTDKQYIVAEFTSAPNNDIAIRDFIDNHTWPFIQEIMNSFHIDYVAGNPASQAVMKMDETPLQQLIDEKIKRLDN